MTRIFINGTFPRNPNEYDWVKELIDKLQSYDIEYYIPTDDNDKNIYEHDFNCDTILYIINNVHTPHNLLIGTEFIDDCWSSLSHTSTIKHIGIFLIDDNDNNDEETNNMKNYIGAIFDHGAHINPYKLCCSFVKNIDDVLKLLEESKVIEKIYE